MLTIKSKSNQYTKAGGSVVFVYVLTGSKEELADYKTVQATNYRENEQKEPLYFTNQPCTVGTQLTKTTKGTFVVQRDLEAQVTNFENAKNIAAAKLAAMQEFLGLSKQQMQEMLLGQLSV